MRAIIAAAAGAAIALAQLNLPNKDFWAANIFLQWLSVIVVALVLFNDAAASASSAIQAARVREYENGLRTTMSATIAAIVKTFNVPWDEISVYYYRARHFSRLRRITRVGGVRAGTSVADMQISFRPSVGIAGTAFSEEVIIALEWRDFARAATIRGPQEWRRRMPRARYGLTWGQLRRFPAEEGIIASPTFNANGKPDGCILVCSPLKLSALSSDAMRQILDNCAAALDRLGPPPNGWWRHHER